MIRYFIQSWKVQRYKDEEVKLRTGRSENQLINETSSARFKNIQIDERDHPIDTIYIYCVLVDKGNLILIGKMQVGKIVTRGQMERFFEPGDFFEGTPSAKYAIASKSTPIRFNFDGPIAIGKVKQMRFADNSRPKLGSDGKLDRQTLRQVRELNKDSANLLDGFLTKRKSRMRSTNLV